LFVKYLFDKLVAFVGLCITAPIFFIVGIVLKIQLEDIFYRQTRVGYHGEDIKVFKFTTMPKGSENLGLITTTNDSRPTRFGKFLRKAKFNEIPQLINVLIGDMSFIGPRPLVRKQMAESLSSSEIIDYYRMRPGITGAGSLYFHHEDRLLAGVEDPQKYYHQVILPKKKRLESEYAENWSLALDFKIFILTVAVMLLDAFGVEKDLYAYVSKKQTRSE